MYIDLENVVFFHFGTSIEVLGHLNDEMGG
jgi:hypothetical protein